MKRKLLGALLIIIAGGIAATVLYLNSQQRHIPLVFSPKNMLASVWENYKKDYWEQGTGRTVDRQRDHITTSEGQSYTMLRAVWMDDKPTFDKTWQWTKANLQRPEDKLFSWLYGKKQDGTWGVLTDQGGQNAAADGDTDIALALLLAHGRWQDDTYLHESKEIINAIWEHEVVMVNGVPYLASNNVEKRSPSPTIVFNPSYFAPYAYRTFAYVDSDHDWNAVASSSYDLLARSIELPLDRETSSGMPPDWILMDRATGELVASTEPNLTTNYSYDAMRTPWRIAMDYYWYEASEAKNTLSKFSFLRNQWENQGVLYATYSHDGKIISQVEAPAMYGGAIGFFSVATPDIAQAVYEKKLQSLYNPDAQAWKKPMSYYDDNWAWFGLALYHKSAPNLAEGPSTGPRTSTVDDSTILIKQ